MKPQDQQVPFFLAIEDSESHGHAYYELKPQTVDQAIDTAESLWQRLNKSNVYAIYVFDAYCQKCGETATIADSTCPYDESAPEHQWSAATHLDFVHCRIAHTQDEDPAIAAELDEMWRDATETKENE